MKRKKNLNKKKNKLLLLILLVLGISVGYAFISSTISINGTAGVNKNTWNIHWDENSVEETEGSVTPKSAAVVVGEKKDNVTFNVEFELPGDFYEFTVDAKNYGTINGEIDDFDIKFYTADEEEIEQLPSYIKYSFTYANDDEVEKGDVLEAGQSKKYKFRIEFDEKASEIPDDFEPISPKLIIDEIPTKKVDNENYKVTFDPNGGTVDPTVINVKAGDSIGQLPVPVKGESFFDGWWTDLSGGVRVDETYVPTGNITLKAKWKDKCTITLNPNGGTVSPTSVEAYTGDTLTNLPVPRWEEHTYSGWYTGLTDGIRVDSNYIVTDSVTLYAHWTGWVFVNEDTSTSLQDQQWSYYQDGVRIESGFATLEDFYGLQQKYYFENGIAHMGWLHINGDHYYFSDNDDDGNGYVNCGAFHNEMKEIDGNLYTFGPDGKCLNYDEYLRCEGHINLTLDSHEECPNNQNIIPTEGIVCKRAEYLHQEKCQDDTSDSWYCAGDGYLAEGATHSGNGYRATALKDTDIVTYGNCGTSGQLNSGDAFICDVNGDKLFNEKTERFYYVSDYFNTKTLQFESDTAVLIFYINMYDGLRCNQDDRQVWYNKNSNTILNGPGNNLMNQLPTPSKWSNVSLKNTNRDILGEMRDTHNSPTSGGEILPTDFSYEGYVARYLTAQELMSGCNITRIPVANSNSAAELTNCLYLLENTKYTMYNNTYNGYWLETVAANWKYSAWTVNSPFRKAQGENPDYYQTQNGARPVIEVPKTKILY